MPGGGFPAYGIVFWSDPVDLFGSGDKDEDLLSAHDASLSGQFVRWWVLRIMAQEATPKAAADSKPRRSVERNKSFKLLRC